MDYTIGELAGLAGISTRTLRHYDGVGLEEIRRLLGSAGYDRLGTLQGHLKALTERREHIDRLIANVRRTIGSMKGEGTMKDREKFDEFKREMIRENERKYGKEVRAKYGEAAAAASEAKMAGMTAREYERAQELSGEIAEALREAMAEGDTAGAAAQKACDLHRQWLCMFWPDGMYSKEAHRALGRSYVEDERFKAYYDRIGEGAADFLHEALEIYCAE